MVRREKKHVAEASDLSSHLSDTSSLSSDPPGSGGSEKDSDDEDDDNRSRGVKPKATSKKATKKQAADSKRKAKSKQLTTAAAKSKPNRPKSIPEKKLKDSHKNPSNASDQYCICRGGYNGKEFMVACDLCHEWFHGRCIGISEKNVPDHYYCDNCQQVSEEVTPTGPAKKGKKLAKAKTGKAKATAAAKTQRNKAEIKAEPPIVETVIKSSLVEQDADIDLEDEDLDDICPVCDSECTCGSKVKTETITIPAIALDPVVPSTAGNNFVHDSGVIEIIGEDTTQPKRGKAKTKASEKKGKDKSDKSSTNKKRSNTKKPPVLPKLEIEEESMDDDVASVTEDVSYMSDMSDAVQSSGSYLEGPVYSYSEGSLHIDSGDDEDIEEEEERAMIEQWELLQDQDELSDSSSEEDFDLDDEETMAIMLEDQIESDEDIYTNDFIHQVNRWSSDEDDEEEEGYEEELDESDIDNVFDNDEENFDDDDEYDSDDGDSANMQFSPFFDENTDVSELLDNIAAALALSISLPSETGEEASDLTQQLQRALIDAGIDLSTIDEQQLESSISEVDEPVTSITPASNDSDVDVTGTPDDSTSPITQLEHQPTAPALIEESESATALSQSLVSDLLLASGQGAGSKIDSELIAAAVQDIVNAATGNAKQGMLSSAQNNSALLEASPLTPNSGMSFGDTVTPPVPESSSSSSLKRGLEEGDNSDRQQKRRLSISKEQATNTAVKDEIEHSAVLMDDLVDTSRLYTRSTSRSPSPEPAEINRFSQDLSRWQRVPIGTFRRSRRVSAPMIQASAALKSGNDEFASTLLCDLEDSPATNAYNATVPKKRRRPKHRGRSAAKSMSDLASIIQKSKDLLPANFNALQGDQGSGALASNGMASNSALPSTISIAIANAVAAIRQSNGGRRPIRQGSLSSGLDTDQPPSSACSSPLYSPLFAGIRNTDLSIPDLHLDDVVAELQKQEEEKSAAQRKGRRPSKLSSALT
ncbi:hypothetical protein K450DRAFT_235743 [Umbelopsis ramanniana AG]|uniref:PHD-type domain-containing protein n=1 Tax=Umbelopsis ramanniana AG TaxID=1314678 RepID=A0AAD5HDW6_UMBRA|nr:uncharacterized protein K450DRAFT_235743 [Umbelopsis ramanniana AG]KAI8580740.1 hypothetical protein K450DRAFT_235743 [Umbelopsis ramanniana AG]